MTDEEVFAQFLELNGITDEVLVRYYRNSIEFQSYLLGYRWTELTDAITDCVQDMLTKISDKLSFAEEVYMCRPPVEIKKELKRERNPMRIKQLNKELNESYKTYGKVKTKKEDHV